MRRIDRRVLAGRVILVVEDHDDTRSMLKDLLEAYGAFVLAARDGHEARKRATGMVDLIITDLAMPRQDGVGLMQGLRKWLETPAIAVSGRIDPESVHREHPGLFCAVLQKPCDLGELLFEVANAVPAR